MSKTKITSPRVKVARRQLRRRTIPIIYKGLVWSAMVIAWYIVFALLIDMPAEHRLRHSVDDMRLEYAKLEKAHKVTTTLEDVYKIPSQAGV